MRSRRWAIAVNVWVKHSTDHLRNICINLLSNALPLRRMGVTDGRGGMGVTDGCGGGWSSRVDGYGGRSRWMIAVNVGVKHSTKHLCDICINLLSNALPLPGRVCGILPLRRIVYGLAVISIEFWHHIYLRARR